MPAGALSSRNLAVALISALAATASVSRGVENTAEPVMDGQVAVEVSPVEDPEVRVAVTLVRDGATASGRVSLAPGSYRVSSPDPRWWVPAEVMLPRGDTNQQLRAWITGELLLAVKARDTTDIPPLLVQFKPCPQDGQRSQEPSGTLSVTPHNGKVRCRLPAVCLDLVLLSERFAPVDLVAVRTTPESPTPLTPVTLTPGGSVAGTIVHARDGLGLERVAVILFGPEAADSKSRHGERVSVRAETNARGSYRFSGLHSGIYALRIGGGDYPSVRLDGIPVVEGHEFSLSTMELGPPAALRVQVSPRESHTAVPWRVWLSPASEPYRAMETKETSEDGAVMFASLPAGRYVVRVESGGGDSSAWLEEREVIVDWGDEALFQIDVNVCELTGRVLLGEDPLRARLRFIRDGSGTAPYWDVETDEVGAFATVVPQPGAYSVEVSSQNLGVISSRTLEVHKCGHEVVVCLPATRISGTVTWDDGEKAVGSDIFVSPTVVAGPGENAILRTTSDSEGNFTLAGLGPGDYLLQAGGEGAWSDRHSISVVKDKVITGVILRIPRTRSLEGTVRDSAGNPVAASVRVTWYGAGNSGLTSAVTESDGRFELSIGAGAEFIAAIVEPLLHSWTTVFRSCCDRLEIVVPGDQATVSVLPAGSFWARDPRNLSWLLRREGVYVPPGDIFAWAGQNRGWQSNGGAALPLPPLAPGTWEICVFADFVSLEKAASSGGQQPCVLLRLLPGEHLDLRLDDILRSR